MLSSSIATFNNGFIVMDVLFFLYIINNFLVGSCSCYSTFFSSSYYYFPSYTSNPYYRKTEIDMKKWFSQTGWNCLPAILSTVFMTSFRLVFMISTKRWFFDCVTLPENWVNRFSWKFFLRYLGHLCIAERSLIEISWKLWSTEFFEKCVRPVFMTFFCKNTEGKMVQTWNLVHI